MMSAVNGGADMMMMNGLKRPADESEFDGMPQNYDGPPDPKRAPTSFDQEGMPTDSAYLYEHPDAAANPGLTTVNYPVPDNLVGLVIGRGGEQITKIQAETGCRVAVIPQSSGQATRPCTLTGSAEQIEAAKLKLDDIIARGQAKLNADLSTNNGHPAPSANELMNQNVATTAAIPGNIQEEIVIPHDKCGIVIGKGGQTLRNLRSTYGCSVNLDSTENTGDDKPLRIAGPPEQVRLVVAEVHKMMAAKESIQSIKVPPGQDHVQFMIPKISVGVVIGKSGETINKIQESTQTRIQFVPDDPTISDRGCYIVGPQEGCLSAKAQVLEIVKKKMEEVESGKGPAPRTQRVQKVPTVGEQQVDYPVPANRAGVVIGKGGDTINQIKEKSGAFVQINKNPPQEHPDWKYFTIRGSQSQIAHAQKLIQEKVGGPAPPGAAISSNATSGGYSYQPQTQGHQQQQQQQQSYNQGYGQQSYGQPAPGGGASQDYSAAWANYYAQMGQSAPQSQAAAPNPGQGQDYSKAWEEYFRRVQQQQGGQPGGQPSGQSGGRQQPQSGQNGGGQSDYSAEWAEYYRKLAEYHKSNPQA